MILSKKTMTSEEVLKQSVWNGISFESYHLRTLSCFTRRKTWNYLLLFVPPSLPVSLSVCVSNHFSLRCNPVTNYPFNRHVCYSLLKGIFTQMFVQHLSLFVHNKQLFCIWLTCLSSWKCSKSVLFTHLPLILTKQTLFSCKLFRLKNWLNFSCPTESTKHWSIRIGLQKTMTLWWWSSLSVTKMVFIGNLLENDFPLGLWFQSFYAIKQNKEQTESKPKQRTENSRGKHEWNMKKIHEEVTETQAT